MKTKFFLKLPGSIAVKWAILSVIGLFPLLARSQADAPVIPKPNQVSLQKGRFSFSNCVISDTNFEARYLREELKKNFGINVESRGQSKRIRFLLISADTMPGYPEYYKLEINEDKIDISSFNETGWFYGVQTLLQLVNAGNQTAPCVSIADNPQYQWRGMHLDVCRHFFTKQEVKKYIDYLALYKFNVFHWHLTDDQGWRIEIKKYPNLTSVSAWRKGSQVGTYTDQKFDSLKYGGFYSQNDITEIVAYASARHITIVPEIEMPGHAMAALAAYPQLSCTGGPFEVARGWGVFDDVYCPKEETFIFLQDVLDEVCELFPGQYIHIGGDECPKTRWKNCAHCRAVIKKEGLKDEHELQSYFVKRIEKYLNTKGKQIIGWDEILEGGLAPNAAVMSWRGTAGGIEAAKEKHKVVMSPGKPCYFDHYQSADKSKEPLAIGGYNPLDSVYAYNPTPQELSREEQSSILGAQANVWTEYITSFAQVEYMALPRMCALAEVLWTKPENKNYDNFIVRLKEHKFMLDKMKVNYAKHFLQKP